SLGLFRGRGSLSVRIHPRYRLLRQARLVGHQEPVAHRIAGRVEEASAAMDMAPPFIGEALLVVAKEEELSELLVADRGDIVRPRDMRLAGPAEFEFRAIFLAIGAVDQKHARLRGWK